MTEHNHTDLLLVDRLLLRMKKERNSFLNLLGRVKSPRQNLYATFYFLQIQSELLLFTFFSVVWLLMLLSIHPDMILHKYTNSQIYKYTTASSSEKEKNKSDSQSSGLLLLLSIHPDIPDMSLCLSKAATRITNQI